MSDYGNLMAALQAEHARVCAERDELRVRLDVMQASMAGAILPGAAAINPHNPLAPAIVTVDHDATHQAEIDRIIAESKPDA